jgi:hypothetical protein
VLAGIQAQSGRWDFSWRRSIDRQPGAGAKVLARRIARHDDDARLYGFETLREIGAALSYRRRTGLHHTLIEQGARLIEMAPAARELTLFVRSEACVLVRFVGPHRRVDGGEERDDGRRALHRHHGLKRSRPLESTV